MDQIPAKTYKASARFRLYLREHGVLPGDVLTSKALCFMYYRYCAGLGLITNETCAHIHRWRHNTRGNANTAIRGQMDHGYFQKLKRGVYKIVRLEAI